MVTDFNGVGTLSAAVEKFRSISGFKFDGTPAQIKTADELGCRLGDNAVSPLVDSPTSKALDPGAPPTFSWTTGGTTTFPLDHFTAYFIDADTGTFIVKQADVPRDGGSTGTTFKWTPKVTDTSWKKLVTTVKKDGTYPNLTLEVEGTGQTPSPTTGPYPGCGADIGKLTTTLTAKKRSSYLFPPDDLCRQDGNCSPDQSSFDVSATGLIPNETYDLTLTGKAGGFTANAKVGTIKADDKGKVSAQTFFLPQIPAHKSWTLQAKPQSGGYMPKTQLSTTFLFESFTTGDSSKYTEYWDGTGWKPGTTVTLVSEGVTILTATVGANGSFPMTSVNKACRQGSTAMKFTGVTLDDGTLTHDFNLPAGICGSTGSLAARSTSWHSY